MCWNLHSLYRSRNSGSLNIKLFNARITMIILWRRVVTQRFLWTKVRMISSCNFMTRRDQLVVAIGAFHQIFESCPVWFHKSFAEGMGPFLVVEFWREGTCDALRLCISLLAWGPPELCLLSGAAAAKCVAQGLPFVELGSLRAAMSKQPTST